MDVTRSKKIEHTITVIFSEEDIIFLIKERLKAGGLLPVVPSNAQLKIEFDCGSHGIDAAIATVTTTEYLPNTDEYGKPHT